MRTSLYQSFPKNLTVRFLDYLIELEESDGEGAIASTNWV
jgi:hypothetical protein